MTPQQRKEASRYLKAFDFSGLFTDPSIGWDWPDTGKPLNVPVPWRGKDAFHGLETIAEKKGVRVFHVPPLPDGHIMPSDERKKLEKAVTPLATEHLLIFTDAAKTRQIWLWTSRLPGKPVRHRELTWEKGRENELLLQKITSIAFTLDEEEALDITGVVQRLRDNFDRDKLTKKFYTDFKHHKDAFQKFIKGISNEGIMAHYTSLMLNRLMFCYFLQQKDFLDGDRHYLRNRFEKVRESYGEDQFHSFYRSFLRRLFHDGLDAQSRPDELTAIIGKNIPYLNGGIFAEHKIEKENPNIQIPDEAFGKIFAFFDEWNWHLDDRPLADGNEINPEVLGYVFEKYTNQKEMGAYYTKEDITEYISKNTILPFLLQKITAKLPAGTWDLLKSDPDRYIYEPVRRGAGKDEKEWKNSLPENIAIGLDTKAPKLIERRKDWNTPTPSSHALPTEIWRETIARHQRCHGLREKLRAGEVTDPADLVTLNLDIRQFTQDVISSAPGDLALAMWKALRSMSVLDPTCGSGAFLFAALEILEPLYEGLLERFRALLADWQSSGEKHPNWEKEIKAILTAVDHHPNEAYFIHKTIIVHNLYGVDIMEEAVEICKLRLFLKLAAQLQPGQAVEPLPDIDFNVRSGNTLVGYASRDEIKKAVETDPSIKKQVDGREQGMLLGAVADIDAYTLIMEEAEEVDLLYKQFQNQQDLGTESAAEQRNTKQVIESKLASLRSQLDRFLAGQYDQKNLKSDATFRKWQASHEPFHWFVEFYGIMNGGGFDVIVGNPPYVEYSKVRSQYTVGGYQTEACNNLYALVFERSIAVLSEFGRLGLIVPNSSISAQKMAPLQSIARKSSVWVSSFSWRPSLLFEGANMLLAIWIISKEVDNSIQSSKYHRWPSEYRPLLFPCVAYSDVTDIVTDFQIPKLPEAIGKSIIQKCRRQAGATDLFSSTGRGAHPIFYFRAVLYWFKVLRLSPIMEEDGVPTTTSEMKRLEFEESGIRDAAWCCLASNLFTFFYVTWSSCQVVNRPDLEFPIDLKSFSEADLKKFTQLADSCEQDLLEKSSIQTRNYSARGRSYTMRKQYFYFRNSKPLIDEIDTLLAEHYGFTEEELDFIINYDIKYRMGLGGGSAEEVEDE
jgi:hypothetical protein